MSLEVCHFFIFDTVFAEKLIASDYFLYFIDLIIRPLLHLMKLSSVVSSVTDEKAFTDLVLLNMHNRSV